MADKVFFITNGLSGGGAERVMSVLANYLVDHGHQVSFLMLHNVPEAYALNKKVRCFYKEDRRGRDVLGQIFFIRKYMLENPGEVFVSFFTFQSFYTILASIGTKAKVIVSERNDPSKTVNGKFGAFIRNILYGSRWCQQIVFQTPGAMGYFPVKIVKKGSVIPNPLKDGLPSRWEGVRKKEIVSVGRLDAQKNFPLLINAFEEVHRKFPEYTLKIFGKGIMEAELRTYVKQLGLENDVIFCGFQSNVHSQIVGASVFVMSSDYEGLSNAMLEALAMGIPTICTDCPPGGAQMFIKHGINGFLTKVGNRTEMIQAIDKVLSDSEAAEKMGIAASALREELNTRVICRQWETILLNE